MPVSTSQRYSSHSPCPICGGHPRLPHGKGTRCFGFRSEDGRFARCTREEHAAASTVLRYDERAHAWVHRVPRT